jgi:hypothetical protein
MRYAGFVESGNSFVEALAVLTIQPFDADSLTKIGEAR